MERWSDLSGAMRATCGMLIFMTAGLMTMDRMGSSTRRLWRPQRPGGGGGGGLQVGHQDRIPVPWLADSVCSRLMANPMKAMAPWAVTPVFQPCKLRKRGQIGRRSGSLEGKGGAGGGGGR